MAAAAGALIIGKLLLESNDISCHRFLGGACRTGWRAELFSCGALEFQHKRWRRKQTRVRKLIAFDDDTFDKLKQLGRDRMATIQELADEAFADVLKKHGIPVDLKEALRKSASLSKTPATRISPQKPARSKSPGKPKS